MSNTFCAALEAVKAGKTIKRANWNSKDQFVFLDHGSFDFNLFKNVEVDESVTIQGVNLKYFQEGDKETITRMPSLCMQLSTGEVVVGWLASQTDMLAEDWIVQ